MMIDIETCALSTSAAVWEVGWVTWDEVHFPGSGGQFFLDIANHAQSRRRIDDDTVRFLEKDAPSWAAYQDFRDFRDEDNLKTLAAAIDEADHVWCKGASFDFAILKDLFEDYGIATPPRAYRKERCMRVLQAMYPRVRLELDPESVHGALYDAQEQMKWVAAAWSRWKRERYIARRAAEEGLHIQLLEPVG
jgi:hypothetical protein